MIHWADPARIRGRVRALTAIAVSLSLLVVSTVAASHSHEGEAESAAECSVCHVGNTPGHKTGSHPPGLTVPNLFRTPAITEHGPAPTALHFASHRSRAPPLSVSL